MLWGKLFSRSSQYLPNFFINVPFSGAEAAPVCAAPLVRVMITPRSGSSGEWAALPIPAGLLAASGRNAEERPAGSAGRSFGYSVLPAVSSLSSGDDLDGNAPDSAAAPGHQRDQPLRGVRGAYALG